MRIHPYIAPILVGFIILAIQTNLGSAAEIKVLSIRAAMGVLSELGPRFFFRYLARFQF
jgi:hypothetical protein